MNQKNLTKKHLLSSFPLIPTKNNFNYELYGIPDFQITRRSGGTQELWKNINHIGQKIDCPRPQLDGEEMGGSSRVNNITVGRLDNQIIKVDESKLLYNQRIYPENYETLNELLNAFFYWWTETENHSDNTGNEHIKSLERMAKHPVFPVDWFDLDNQIEQIINQLLYFDRHYYVEKRRIEDKPDFGLNQINNFIKAINVFGQANGIHGLGKFVKSYLHLKKTPRPRMPNLPPPPVVNKLIHHRYCRDPVINAEIKTILSVGFHTGPRPTELISMKLSYIDGRRMKIRKREDKVNNPDNQVDVEKAVLYGHQQPSVITNWIQLHRKRLLERLGISEEQDEGWLFPDPNTGKRFRDSKNLYNFLCRRVKPELAKLYPDDDFDFFPKIMRTWSGVGKLIQTKVKNKKWDIREVKYHLGHENESDVTEDYVKQANSMYTDHPYDWFRAVLKFHPTSKRMKRLMKEYNRTKPAKDVQKTINDKNTLVSFGTTGGVMSAPVGVETYFLLLGFLKKCP